MGEVIKGPWRRRESPNLTRVLADEILRMTRALEELRELHQRNEPAGDARLQPVPDCRTE